MWCWNWTLWKVHQIYLENYEMLCWRRMEKTSWADRVRNEEVLQSVKEHQYILHTIKIRKVHWIGHILCRNCLLEQLKEGKNRGKDSRDGKMRKT